MDKALVVSSGVTNSVNEETSSPLVDKIVQALWPKVNFHNFESGMYYIKEDCYHSKITMVDGIMVNTFQFLYVSTSVYASKLPISEHLK